ncbi:uncharacterized protein CBL_10307 [Carabus blaptoides fortunei]
MHYLSIYLYFCAFFMTISLSYSDDTTFYRQMSIDNINLCSVITDRKIQLNGTQNALLVTRSFVKRSSEFHCNFKVVAHEHDGLFALIRRLNFRKDLDTGECIDYVQFHTSDNRKRKFCGNLELNAFDIDLIRSSPLDLLDLGMADRHGKIRTTIFIAKEPLPAGMNMDLEIVFTGYSGCNTQHSAQCIPGNTNYCINRAYVADGQVNCPFRDCGDEANCNVRKFIVNMHEEQPVSSTKVVLSAIGSLAVSFLVFIVVLWFCKKAHLICFNEECMNSSAPSARVDTTTRHAQPSRVIEMENRPEADARVVATPEEDKDLPPSYESLFADR